MLKLPNIFLNLKPKPLLSLNPKSHKLTKLIPIQISVKLNSFPVYPHTAYTSPPSDLYSTATGIQQKFSNPPQSLSITSLSLARSLSTKCKLVVLRECLCNLFMTSQVCVDAVAVDVNNIDREVVFWNILFRWGTV